MDLTATTTDLANAAAEAVRLLPGRSLDPVLAGLLLTASDDGVVLAGSDRERAIRLSCSAAVHTPGRVLVPAKPFAETLRALDVPMVRIAVEGARLAVRTPNARFALPLLDADLHPGVPTAPPLAGSVSGELFVSALTTVAATASRDEALPLFTGVRVRADGSRLVLAATDRYRMAVASLPWTSAAPLDALIPAALLAEVAKQARGQVSLHADANRIGLAWDNSVVTTALLDGSFLSESKLVLSAVDTTVELDADTLLAAVRRVALYADSRGVLKLEVGDNEIRLRTADQQAGEAEETIKADVSDGRTSPSFQSRFLVDALKPFSGGRVRLAIQPGMRATVFSSPNPEEVMDLRYMVAPMRPPATT
ncbi:DNA polymerase III subunit beta [Kibdelosporangium philippinense]|uniref:DNA polymerase III subunit beta n=1 Tax=Kibdelosporangium philippinense TaxID=211113 RepID=A0ABS8ZNM3_9PSEU|nr:DNA polymerase III subunit beta [Kibdelosporangium philippinense]MCE7009361.1 DNA polymerase III subunit beta [Kibdelosporangium philippinense]